MSEKSTSFRSKILGSAKLSTLKFVSDVGLRLLSTVILSRLLAPDIYGIFAIVMVYLYLLDMLSDLGIRSLILTREGEVEDSFLRTCWTVAILRGLVIALLSVGIAGIIGVLQAQGVFDPENAYSAPALPWAITALGGVSLITAFQSPMLYMSERDMIFGRVTVVYISLNIIALVTTIALAFYLRSIWALVIGAGVKAVFHVILSFVFFPGARMWPQLNREDLGVIIDRGKWIVGHSILTAMSASADRLVLGFVMSSSMFGFYYIARQLVEILSTLLRTIDGQISLQVFTQLHKTTAAEFRRNYYRYRLFFDAVAGLGTGGLYVLAPLVVQVIFDDRYLGAIPIVQTLVWGFLLTGPLLLRSAFSAERRFKDMTLLSVVSTATLWFGLGITVLVFNSVEAALFVIALHRLPEAMLCMLWGGDRDWVVIWREFIGFGFTAIGILLGQGVLYLWRLVV